MVFMLFEIAPAEEPAKAEDRIALPEELKELLPEQLMLQRLAALKKMRPPQTQRSIRKLFGKEPASSMISLNSGLTEEWEIAPGYVACFQYSNSKNPALTSAWIERVVPKFLPKPDEPKVEDLMRIALETQRFSNINPTWTPEGLLYAYEITKAGKKSVLVPFEEVESKERSTSKGTTKK